MGSLSETELQYYKVWTKTKTEEELVDSVFEAYLYFGFVSDVQEMTYLKFVANVIYKKIFEPDSDEIYILNQDQDEYNTCFDYMKNYEIDRIP